MTIDKSKILDDDQFKNPKNDDNDEIDISQIPSSQPRQLYMLFFVEMWERFSFYGMKALLVLYIADFLLAGQMGGADAQMAAIGIASAYASLVYLTPFFGGLIAEKFLGYQKSVMLGAVLMCFGHFIMAFENQLFFYSALSLLIAGNGFFKPNISTMVGGLYYKNDPRRDGGFTIFYMGINLGAGGASIACGIIAEAYGWHYGFGLAGIGMLAGLIVFALGRKSLGKNGLPPNEELLKTKVIAGLNWEWFIYIMSLVALPLIGAIVHQNWIMGYLFVPFALLILLYFVYIAIDERRHNNVVDSDRIWVILGLLLFSTMFWLFFEQAGTSLTLFTDKNVDRNAFGFEIPTASFQSVNALFIIFFAPIFAILWSYLGKANKEPSAPMKFALAMLQLGAGFLILVAGQAAAENSLVPMVFLILAYLLHTTGELCLSPVGLSLVTKLAPKKIVSLVMGGWFLSSALAHFLGGIIAKLTITEGGATQPTPAETLANSMSVFNIIGWVCVGTGILLILLTPLFKKGMHGIN
jgi:proton-dependent oligopeptide transporter, POT family